MCLPRRGKPTRAPGTQSLLGSDPLSGSSLSSPPLVPTESGELGPIVHSDAGVDGEAATLDGMDPALLGDRDSLGEPVESWLARAAAAPDIALGPEFGEVLGGEFRIEQRLGEGGMGVVYLAQHLVLDRRVAIKLHRAATRRAADRLLAEARAAARIAHENVLVVYEVGTWNEHVFVAMEYVDGWTARQWLALSPRSWREVVALYLEAGRGLAAAHAKALVHRDFKPDNVLVSRTSDSGTGRGRARVADFGLARTASDPLESASGEHIRTIDDLALTDGIVGSPAYMAPEQFERSDVDARADQFAFCVALFEGLFGRRPFEGESLSILVHAILVGDLREPAGPQVPIHVRRVLRRGLSADPAARYPDLDTLLLALGRDPAVSRRRRLGLAVAVAATGLVTWAAMRRPDPMQGCTEAPAIASWWNVEAAQRLQVGLRSSGRSFADETFEHIDTALTARTQAASAALEQACQATYVEGSRSVVELGAHRECLTQLGRELEALLEILGRGEPTVVDRAIAAVEALPPIER